MHFLQDIGFIQSKVDPSLYIFQNNGSLAYFMVYVDDILIIGNDQTTISSIIEKLEHCFHMKILRPLSQFLGLTAHSTAISEFLMQQSYAKDLLQRASMQDCHPLPNPMAFKTSPDPSDTQLYDDPTLYCCLVGALQYLTITRPDLSFSVNRLCQHMHQPLISHYKQLKCVLCFTQAMLNKGLLINPTDLYLSSYSDSDWAGDRTDRKSTTSYCIFRGSIPISWAGKKKTTIAKSCTEAKYHALASTAAEVT